MKKQKTRPKQTETTKPKPKPRQETTTKATRCLQVNVPGPQPMSKKCTHQKRAFLPF
jgi:hypothetical protein